MLSPTANDAATITGASALGIRWRSKTRDGAAPRARAAATKSRSRNERTSARTRRATPIHESSPITRMMIPSANLFVSASTAITRKNVGNESSASTIRIIAGAARRAGRRPVERPDDDRDEHRRDPDRQGNSRADHRARELVAP